MAASSAIYSVPVSDLLLKLGWPADVVIVAAQIEFASGNMQLKIQHSSIPKSAVTVDAINKITTTTQVVFDRFVILT